MRPLGNAWSILIEVTNACRLRCAHCSAGVRHVRKPSFADLELIERALVSLKGWRKGVGLFGGEPTLHPDFPAICGLFRKYFPKRQCVIWTCGGPAYEEYRPLIEQTFGIIAYNDHESPGFHQPLMIAADEVVPDPVLRRQLIENCWIEQHWSPTVTHKGAFFCEIAATFDTLFDGPGGQPLEPGWWKTNEAAFAAQRERYCGSCSIPLPIETLPDSEPLEYVSPRNAERLKAAGSPWAQRGQLKIIDRIDLNVVVKRNPRDFAMTGTPHFWTKLSLQSGWWLALQYRHIPRGGKEFIHDLKRFSSLAISQRALTLKARVATMAHRIRETARRSVHLW